MFPLDVENELTVCLSKDFAYLRHWRRYLHVISTKDSESQDYPNYGVLEIVGDILVVLEHADFSRVKIGSRISNEELRCHVILF